MPEQDPLAEPHLEKRGRGADVATGFVDPCVVYLEAKDHGLPVLIVCWARSSCDARKPGEAACLEMHSPLFLAWYPGASPVPAVQRLPQEEGPMLFRAVRFKLLQMTGAAPEIRLLAPEENSPVVATGLATLSGHRRHVQYLTPKQNEMLQSLTGEKEIVLAKYVLALAGLDWPSVRRALRSLAPSREKEPDFDAEADVSIDQAEAGVRAHPDDGRFHYLLGKALFKAGDYKRATQELHLGSKQPEVRYQAFNLMGLSALKLGKPDLAVELLVVAESEQLAMDELKKETAYNLGLAYEELRQPGKALEQWKKIYAYDKGYRDVARRVESASGR